METQEQQQTQTTVGAPVGNGALSQATANPLTAGIMGQAWTRDRLDLIKRTICPKGCSDDEFAIFIEQCKRAEMDPLMGECDLIERKQKVKDYKPDGSHVEREVIRFLFAPREQGMRARADRFPDFRSMKSGVVHEGDKFEFHPGDGTKTVHSYNPADPARKSKPIVGAWAYGEREGRSYSPVWIPFGERYTGLALYSPVWKSMPENQIEKCACMAMWRKMFPNTIGGLYSSEEWQASDATDGEREVNEAPQGSATDKLKEKVQQKAGDAPAATKPASQQTVDAPKPPPADTRPKVIFGEKEGWKGRVIAELDGPMLFQIIDAARARLKDAGNASWAPKVMANLEELNKEVERREFQAADMAARAKANEQARTEQPREREPGEDDIP